jgi:hypothetical protein
MREIVFGGFAILHLFVTFFLTLLQFGLLVGIIMQTVLVCLWVIPIVRIMRADR